MLKMLKGLFKIFGAGTAIGAGLAAGLASEAAKELRALGDSGARKRPEFRDKEDELDWANRRGRWKDC